MKPMKWMPVFLAGLAFASSGCLVIPIPADPPDPSSYWHREIPWVRPDALRSENSGEADDERPVGSSGRDSEVDPKRPLPDISENFCFSLFVNSLDPPLRGVALAGACNRFHDVSGVELALLYNTGSFYGIQIAGLRNEALGREFLGWRREPVTMPLLCTEAFMVGMVPCGLARMSSHRTAVLGEALPSAGLQLAIGWNEARDFQGVQLALLYNKADAVSGLQLAIVNRTERLHGVQIGAFNRACGGSGIQIGLVNGFGPKEDTNWAPFLNIRF